MRTTRMLRRVMETQSDLFRFQWLIISEKQGKIYKIWTWQRRRSFYRETESLLKAAPNNLISQKIDKTQQNSKFRLFGYRDKTINHIINEYTNLPLKEYKTRYSWMGKMIHLELFKKLKFDQTNKWHMQNPESVLEDETHKVFRNFAIHTD